PIYLPPGPYHYLCRATRASWDSCAAAPRGCQSSPRLPAPRLRLALLGLPLRAAGRPVCPPGLGEEGCDALPRRGDWALPCLVACDAPRCPPVRRDLDAAPALPAADLPAAPLPRVRRPSDGCPLANPPLMSKPVPYGSDGNTCVVVGDTMDKLACLFRRPPRPLPCTTPNPGGKALWCDTGWRSSRSSLSSSPSKPRCTINAVTVSPSSS